MADSNLIDQTKATLSHGLKTGSDIKILCVEDNRSNLTLIEKIIGRLPNVTLVSAVTAEEGIEITEKQDFNLILMDINLPGMDGVDALEILKARERTKGIPVVALTAAAMAKDVARGKEAGFYAYITKPIRMSELFEVIERALSLSPAKTNDQEATRK